MYYLENNLAARKPYEPAMYILSETADEQRELTDAFAASALGAAQAGRISSSDVLKLTGGLHFNELVAIVPGGLEGQIYEVLDQDNYKRNLEVRAETVAAQAIGGLLTTAQLREELAITEQYEDKTPAGVWLTADYQEATYEHGTVVPTVYSITDSYNPPGSITAVLAASTEATHFAYAREVSVADGVPSIKPEVARVQLGTITPEGTFNALATIIDDHHPIYSDPLS